MSFENAVQVAIYQKLTNDPSVMALVDAVYDDVPQGCDFPYITIGEDNHVSIDTDLDNYMQVSITIHVWSRENGRKQTKEIQGAIYNSLQRAELVYSGYKFVNIMSESSESFLDADGETRHGVQIFNLIILEQ